MITDFEDSAKELNAGKDWLVETLPKVKKK